ncbi:flagellar hook basal-body protein [bacterium]|nr:flagellar hook basal-body protein [bacterium]
MTTVQGVIRQCLNNTTTQFERLGYVATNFANYSTNGYKCVRFEQMLDENGYLTGVERTNVKQGSIMITDSPYDIALKDDGYIPVTSPEGEVQYTRDGSFKQGKDGYLVTNDGWLVGDGIKIPTNIYRFSIKDDGRVMVMDDKMSKEREIGKISVVRFKNAEALEKGAPNKLKATEESGEAILLKDHNIIAQNSLERANINLYDAVNDMLRLNASMIASMRMAKLADDMYNKSINLREG